MDMINKKVDKSLFKLPFLNDKDHKKYQEKFNLDSRSLSPFFEEEKEEDNFDYEKELNKISKARIRF